MKFKKWIVCFLLIFSTSAHGASTDYKVTNQGVIWGYDLIVKGPWVDVRTYATLALANTAALGAGKSLLITEECILPANTTLTAAVRVIKGGSFTKASTYTLTINGPFEAGPYQVFSGFGAGNVTFGTGAVREVFPEWWGVDGTADDVQIQCAIDSYGAYPGTITLTKQNYNIAATVTKDSTVAANTVRRGYVIRGISPWQTHLTWTGAAFGTMFDLYGVEFSKFENFCLDGDAIAGYGFKIDYHAYYNEFTSVNVEKAKVSLAIGSVDSTSASENVFTNCSFLEGNTAIVLGGANALNNKFLNCNISAQEYGVDTVSGGIFDGGTYYLFNTFGWGTTPTATFYLRASNDAPMDIRNVYDETDNHIFLLSNGNSSGGRGVTITNCTLRIGPTIPTNLIEYHFGGPLLILQSHIGRTNAGVPPGKIYSWPTGSGNTICLIGNTFHTDTSADTAALRTDANWDQFLNILGSAMLTAIGNSWVSAEAYTYPLQDITQTYSYLTALDDTGTPSVRFGDTFVTGGVTAITHFDDGLPGKKITIIAEHTVVITDGTNIFLNGSANFTMNATDTLTLIQKSDGKWYELSRSDNT